MTAILTTKSNYKGINGVLLNVVECKGTRISCYVPYNGFNAKGIENVKHDRTVIADFSIKELTQLFD